MKKAFIFFVVCFTLFALGISNSSFADGAAAVSMVDLMQEINSLKMRVADLEGQVSEQKKSVKNFNLGNDHQKTDVKKTHAKKGRGYTFNIPGVPASFKVGANMTGIVQGAPNAKLIDQDVSGVVGGSYQSNVTLTSEFYNIDGRAFANLRVGQGRGVMDQMTLYSNVDNNAWLDDQFSLSEMWYEQDLFDGKAKITVGKLDPTDYLDKNDYADSDSTQFLGVMFNNSPCIDFPANAGAVRVLLSPLEWMDINYVALAGNSNLTDLQKNLFHSGEVHFKPEINGRKGNYRFLGWFNNDDYTRWDDPSKTKVYSYGVSFSADQQITDNFGVFAKVGWKDPEAYNPDYDVANSLNPFPVPGATTFTVESMWSTGFQLQGNLWGREHDFAGLAIGQVLPSMDMKGANQGSQDARDAKNETHFEAYYNWHVNKAFAVTPGVQLIWDGYGGDSGGKDVMAVFSLRTHVDF